MILRTFLSPFLVLFLWQTHGFAGRGDTAWMRQARFGIFVHYQYRILLGHSIATKPSFPKPEQMTAEEWNRFVDGFDVKGFAEPDGRGEGRLGHLLPRRPLLRLALRSEQSLQ